MGGNTKYHNFKERLQSEVKKLVEYNGMPNEEEVKIFELEDPVLSAWKGLANFCKESQEFEDFTVSKFDYEEEGGLWAFKKFSEL